MTKCSLCSVVVPRHTVILNEGEHRYLVPLKPLPISGRGVAHGRLSRDHVSVEAIYPTAVFAEMAGKTKCGPIHDPFKTGDGPEIWKKVIVHHSRGFYRLNLTPKND